MYLAAVVAALALQTEGPAINTPASPAATSATAASHHALTLGAPKSFTTFDPVAWYRFEDPKNLSGDSSPTAGHNLTLPNCSALAPNRRCPIHEEAGPVGGYITFGGILNGSVPKAWAASAPVAITQWPAITIEFLIKPGPRFLRGGSSVLLQSASVSVELTPDALVFNATTTGSAGTPNDVLTVPFTGRGVLAADSLFGASGHAGGWHHIALVKDATTGNQSVWIDGVSTPEMQIPGNATGRHIAPTSGFLVDASNSVALDGSLDELAVYSEVLPPTLILLHFQQTLNHSRGVKGEPYSNTDPGGTVPPLPLLPSPTDPCNKTWCYWDLEEYPDGTELPSPAGKNNTVGGDVPCVFQMTYGVGPRYNLTAAAEFNTPFNFNWMDPHYMAGATDPITKKFNPQLTAELMEVMAERWRYGPMLWSPASPNNETLALANGHPEWPFNVILPFGKEFRNQTLPNGCYLQNAQGQFIDVTGAVTTKKNLRPLSSALAAAKGCPDSLWAADGLAVAASLKKLAPNFTRPLSVLNLDGEVFVSLDSPAEDYDYSVDPTVLADFKASGAPNWLTYWSEWRVRLTNLATAPYMTDPDLSKGLLKGAKLTMYQVQGTNEFFGNWSVTRHIMSPMTSGRGGPPQYYSTCDLYLQSPKEWWAGGGPDHGLDWLASTRASELAAGDVFSSPFVAAGWSGKVEKNVRPAQWLGFVKIVAMWGGEWFYTGFFNVAFDSHGQMPVSGQWCWQGMVPSFAQAVVVTTAAPFFYHGSLVMADSNASYSGEDQTPWLWAGQPNIVAVARAYDGAFLIALAIEKSDNAKLNLNRATASAAVSLPGVAAPVTLTARLQGSVYVYRNDSSTNHTPSITQLDTWHLATHPSYWPSDVVEVEAELFEGFLGRPTVVRTERRIGAAHDLDFAGFVTHVDLGTAAAHGVPIAYNLTHHGADRATALSVRARGGMVVVNGGDCGRIDAGDAAAGWQWVRVPACSQLSRGEALRLSGTAHVDRLRLFLTQP